MSTNSVIHISCMIVVLMASAVASADTVVWHEGEAMTAAPTGLEKVAGEKFPGSGGFALHGGAVDKKDSVVAYTFDLPADIADAQVIFRYARLHWRDTMVPAEINITLIRDGNLVTQTTAFPNTGGWGSKKAKEFDFLAVPCGKLAAGQYQLILTSLANNNSINLDGFFIAPESFKIENAELDPLNRVLITSQGYVGLSRAATVIRQDIEKTIDFSVRFFDSDVEPAVFTVFLTDENGKKTELPLSPEVVNNQYGAVLLQMALPGNLPDGDYTLTYQAAALEWELSTGVELAGQFLGSLDQRLDKVAAVVAEKLDSESAYRVDFNYLLDYLKTSQAMVAAATEPTVSAWKQGLAQHEGASNAASVVATMRRVMAQYETMAANLEKGAAPFDGMTGLMLRAYKSNATGELWPFHIYIPSSYLTAEKVPHILFLHGGGGDENYWPQLEGGEHMKTLEQRGYMATMPKWHSRNQSPEDVLQLYSMMMDQYDKIDYGRRYMTGVSMGGHGSYRFATNYPSLFTAICCVSGTGKVEDAVKLMDIPIMILQGGADTVVPPAQAIKVNAELERLGYTVDFHLFPTHGHGYYPQYLPMSIDFWEKHTQ